MNNPLFFNKYTQLGTLALVILLSFSIIGYFKFLPIASSFIGALVVGLSEELFAYYAFRYRKAGDVNKIVISFFKGEVLRVLFLVVSTVLILTFSRVEPLGYAIGFMVFIIITPFMRALRVRKW